MRNTPDAPEILDPLHFFAVVLGANAGDFISFATSGGVKDSFRPMLCYPWEFDHALRQGSMFAGKNLYWGCSVMDGVGIKNINCVSTKAIVCDIDYGTFGHRTPSPFATEAEAMANLGKIALAPSMVYNSGHGIVAIYLLRSRLMFADTGNAGLFDDAKARLYYQVRSDSTSSRQHYFRYPCTTNTKPGCEPVCGHIITRLDPGISYELDEIIAALPPVPAKLRVKRSAVTQTPKNELPEMEFGEITSPDELEIPTGLQYVLGHEHPEGTRSESFHKAVLGLYELGASLDCIREVVSRNPSLADKYEGRLDEEIVRCVSKIQPDDFTPLKPDGHIVDLSMEADE